MIRDLILFVLLILTAIPVTLFALNYAASGTWRGNREGTAMLYAFSGFALWVDLELAYALFPLPYPRVASIALLVLLASGAWGLLLTWFASRRDDS